MSNEIGNPSCTKELTTIWLKKYTDVLYECAQSCFLMSNPKKWKNKRENKEQSKPWFDDSCALLKKRLLNQVRLLKKNPRDPYIRGVYITCRKEYRKLIKENKKIHKL